LHASFEQSGKNGFGMLSRQRLHVERFTPRRFERLVPKDAHKNRPDQSECVKPGISAAHFAAVLRLFD
jgi:hypothetical protein